MPTINATVNWPDSQKLPSVNPNPIAVPATDRNATIAWSCGQNVASFEISGLPLPEFSAAGSGGEVTSFTVTDRNDDTTEYSYMVSATHTSGRKARHDPKIKNGST